MNTMLAKMQTLCNKVFSWINLEDALPVFCIKGVSTQHFQSFIAMSSTRDCARDHSSMTHKVAYSAGDLAMYVSNNTKLWYK